MDLQIYSNYGFTEDDIRAAEDTDGVKTVMAAKFADVSVSDDADRLTARVHSYTEDPEVNAFHLIEGRLPENSHEVLAEYQRDGKSPFAIGTVVHFSRPAGDLDTYLNVDEAEVVGLVETPVYLNHNKGVSTLQNQTLDTFFYLPEEAFALDYAAELDILTEDGRNYDAFSDAYYDYIDTVKENLEDLAVSQEDENYQEIKDDALASYQNGLSEYRSGMDELEKQIQDGQAEIDDAQRQITAGLQEISDGETKLQDAEKQLQERETSVTAQLNSALQEIDSGLSQISETLSSFDETKTQAEEILQKYIQTNEQLVSLENLSSMLAYFDETMSMKDVLNVLQADDAVIQQLSALDPEYEVHTVKETEAVISETETAAGSGLTEMQDGLLKIADSFAAYDTEKKGEALQTELSETSSLYAEEKELIRQDTALETLLKSLADLPQETPLSAGGENIQSLAEDGGLDLSGLETVSDLTAAAQTKLAADEERMNEIQASLRDHDTALHSDLAGVLASAETGLASQQTDLEAKKSEAESGLAALQAEVNRAKAEIAANRQTLAEKKQELEESQSELNASQAELLKAEQEGREKLADAAEDLKAAKEEIDAMEAGEWTILTRRQHYASAAYQASIDQMAAIGEIFPIFFIMVAVLVCLTTMARTVSEQRGELGIMRALGYTNMQCAAKYLMYALLAAVLGEAAGVVIGMATFPRIIYETWRLMYSLPDMVVKMDWGLYALVCVIFIAVMVLTSLGVCLNELQEVPSQLLRPKAPKVGRGIWMEKMRFWKHLSFSRKVTIRNIVRYRSRFIMTVAGIAGCTALLITGFGVKGSLKDMVDLQYGQILQYDTLAEISDLLSSSEAESLRSDLEARDDTDEAYLIHAYSSGTEEKEDTTIQVMLFADNEEAEKAVNLRTRRGHRPLKLSDDGVIIDEKLSEILGVQAGDIVKIEDENGNAIEVKVDGICEMYLNHYCFMSEDYYQKVTGERALKRCILLKNSGDISALRDTLSDNQDIESVSFNETEIASYETMISSMDIIIWVIIIASMALAFVVLGNLTNVNISERQREIATLKVLGFRRREVLNYIYKENNILTFCGGIFGIPLGIWLHHTIMCTVESDYMMFGRTIGVLSILISVALTMLFGILVNFFMRRRITSIQMVESLKSVE